jgi:hypothetical protein
MEDFDDLDADLLLGIDPHKDPVPANVRPDPRRHRVVCKHWLRGLCKKGDNCDFLHRLDHERMPECWYFSNFGECGNKECIFLHVRPEKTTECPWYARGFCKHGQRCRNRHTRKKPCPKYLAGFCPEGPACQFGHPKCARLDLASHCQNNTVGSRTASPLTLPCLTVRTGGNFHRYQTRSRPGYRSRAAQGRVAVCAGDQRRSGVPGGRAVGSGASCQLMRRISFSVST